MTPCLPNPDRLQSHELGLKFRIAVLKEHGDDFPKVLHQLVQGRPLSVGAGRSERGTEAVARLWYFLLRACDTARTVLDPVSNEFV